MSPRDYFTPWEINRLTEAMKKARADVRDIIEIVPLENKIMNEANEELSRYTHLIAKLGC